MRPFETSPGHHNYAMQWDRFLIQCQYDTEFSTYGTETKKGLYNLLQAAGNKVVAIFKVTPKTKSNGTNNK